MTDEQITADVHEMLQSLEDQGVDLDALARSFRDLAVPKDRGSLVSGLRLNALGLPILSNEASDRLASLSAKLAKAKQELVDLGSAPSPHGNPSGFRAWQQQSEKLDRKIGLLQFQVNELSAGSAPPPPKVGTQIGDRLEAESDEYIKTHYGVDKKALEGSC